MVATGHMELFKYEVSENLSSSVALATFLLSCGQVLLVAATLDRVDKGTWPALQSSVDQCLSDSG